MQIDYHFGTTYVLARMAGFDSIDADVIAHSAQYVDDATQSGENLFSNQMRYQRASSAHKMMQYANLDSFANRMTWLPFHFLPGNDGEPKPSSPVAYDQDEFIRRCICRPDSHVAKDMMRTIISRQDRSYALHRLGIATHTFVDTWAHQRFVGFTHKVNSSTNIVADDGHHTTTFAERVDQLYHGALDLVEGTFVNKVFPLGHGGVLSYPDRPYLVWSYTDGLVEPVKRDNPDIFRKASRAAFRNFVRYRRYPDVGEKVFDDDFDLPSEFAALDDAFITTNDEDGDVRFQKWIGYIADGRFGFSDRVSYIAKGSGSWKAIALGIDDDVAGTAQDPVPYLETFPTSNWKLFHDALMAHQFYVLHELLPDYGLLAA